MGNVYSHHPKRVWYKAVLAMLATLCLILLSSFTALASTVNIYDQGNILNDSPVQKAAAQLSKPISIYTVPNFTGSNTAFANEAKSEISNPNLIVIAIKPHYVAVVGGKNVGLSQSQYNDAVNAFINSYKSNQNYTTATVAAINSLKGSLNGGLFSSVGSNAGIGSSWFNNCLCCVGVLLLLLLAGFVFARRRRGPGAGFGNLFGGFRRPRPGYGQYNDPNYQGPYPPNYQGPYPPNYQGPYPPQGGGMNPWAAGGLGAAAGGLFGYELGRQSGEREERDRDYNDGGDYGGGAGGSFGEDGGFGGDNGGDFGGGAGGSFGGGDGGFGGGDGGFGGDGGGFGGDSGNNDFGGGSGGSF
jgi:hypothetical protein